MANWGCNTCLDVFMYFVVILFALGGFAFFGFFLSCAVDDDACSRDETIAGFALFIGLSIASCLGCVYFCSCSLSKDELEKRRELQNARRQPLVIPVRRYQKQNSQFLKNVVYKDPHGKDLDIAPTEESIEEGSIENNSSRNLLADQNQQRNLV
eukprot:TRINITY_DN1395_c0_g1_i10.p3 TRINITY_DN1395_c0_g1~~TRINITY_DN1395_c0_g1_i10.p3  ORF type:complete len:154 (-),score=14.29 TRINITY_DN1395_c0_g1_i10:956-1417(-)